mmetsp:Transcript_8080/g.18810  ORF Transcript_8080/g.18810 Transcript_8080/m.18810 type:complete len:217 (+) Transcript_8080:1069-1719(+)
MSWPTRKRRMRTSAFVPRHRPILTVPRASTLSVSPIATSAVGTSHAACASTSLSSLDLDPEDRSTPAKSLSILTPGMRRSSPPELRRVICLCLAGLAGEADAYVSGGRSGGEPLKFTSSHVMGLCGRLVPDTETSLDVQDDSENLGGRSECGESLGDNRCTHDSGVRRSVSSSSSSSQLGDFTCTAQPCRQAARLIASAAVRLSPADKPFDELAGI